MITGTGGVAGFSSIDPALKRPYLDEAVLGFDARPSPRTFLRIAAPTFVEHGDQFLVGRELVRVELGG